MASLFGNTVARYSSDSQRSFTGVPSSPSLSRSTWPANRLPNLVIMIEFLHGSGSSGPSCRAHVNLPGRALECARVGHKSDTTGHEMRPSPRAPASPVAEHRVPDLEYDSGPEAP